MAPTEGTTRLDVELVELGADDVADGFALTEEAGWNQTADDWAMMIRLGRAFGVPGPEGHLIATALALPYPQDFGWISMVLVHGPFRRRGLATCLLERSIAELRDRGLVPVLDATPAGQAVYERMGFRPIDALTRWRRLGGSRNPVEPGPGGELGDLAALDRAAFGADRSAILTSLLSRAGAVCVRDPARRGFLLSRPGRTATYVGPIVARDTEVALGLVEAGLAATAGPVLIDIPDREVEVAGLLARHGFEAERPFTRMALGRDTAFGEPELVRAIAAPELG
jgi:GNAT superfamily N-acetyltransferase